MQLNELNESMQELTNEELAVLIQITKAASIQGKDARFIADLIDKLTQSVKDND